MHHAIRILTLVAATGLVAGQASAQVVCPGGTTRVTTTLQSLISGNTVCGGSSSNSDTWQEYHQGAGSGPLIDWKLGPNHPVDPMSQVGTWSAGNDANALLTHTYGTSVYSWLVCQSGTSNNFALVSTSGAATLTGVTVKAGQGACPSLPNAASVKDVRPPIIKRAPTAAPANRNAP
jgi:hypothetical protein